MRAEVFKQSPDANVEVPKGSTVTIYVSSGKDTFELKDYKGYSQSEAESALKSLGLTVRVDYANNDSVDEGDVISTNPAAGSSVSAGDTITIVISRGSEEVDIPYVIDKTEAEAKEALKAAQALTFQQNILTAIKQKVQWQTSAITAAAL